MKFKGYIKKWLYYIFLKICWSKKKKKKKTSLVLTTDIWKFSVTAVKVCKRSIFILSHDIDLISNSSKHLLFFVKNLLEP